MEDGTTIIVEDSSIHPGSGHISIRVHSVTTEGNKTTNGPSRIYGVDATMFKNRFNGDIEQVKAWIKSEHIGYQGAHESLVKEVNALKGQAL